MKMLKLLRGNKKGFTLVELIVVLVILAILAAILIPSLTGYVDKANERTVMAEARSAYLAAQTLASEQYALGNSISGDISAATAFTLADIEELAETPSGTVTACTVTAGVVTAMTYTNNDHTATYSSTGDPAWTVA